jgi:hypothetical protein
MKRLSFNVEIGSGVRGGIAFLEASLSHSSAIHYSLIHLPDLNSQDFHPPADFL